MFNEKTAFSWPVVGSIVACAVVLGGGKMHLDTLQRDHDLLRARVDLLEHQQGADRSQLHAQGATLAEVKTVLHGLRDDIRDALRRGIRPVSESE